MQQDSSLASTSAEHIDMELNLGCQLVEGSKQKLSIWDKFDKQVASSKSQQQQMQSSSSTSSECYQHELKLYLSEDTLPRSSCPFKWWNSNQARFPLVADVAREYLSIPGTSVPSERLFSKAGETLTKKRSSLKPQKADQTIFLMENM